MFYAFITLILTLAACGTDPAKDIPAVTADGNGVTVTRGEKGDKGDKGEKGDPGEKGEKGDAGAAGTNGKDGAQGIDGQAGKDGEVAPSGVWKDPLTGRQWMYMQGKFTADQVGGLCAPWKQPTSDDIKPAIQHGLVIGLPIPNAAATERAWTTELAANNDLGAVIVVDPNVLFLGVFNHFSRGNQFRLYCVKN